MTPEQNNPHSKSTTPSSPDEHSRTQSSAASTQPPQVVYLARPLTPHEPHISDEIIKRHNDSKQAYPELNLSDGEYIISAIRRHPIGLIEIWAVVGVMAILVFAFLPFYASNQASLAGLFSQSAEALPSAAILSVPLLILTGLFVLGGFLATIVYTGNKFFLTNESVIQIIRISLFSTKEQTISLANIEDASFRRHGLLQTLLNYGTLRLSTEGDETTYRFSYVSNPKQQVSVLNNSVEAFKNGRPVDPDENS